MYQREFTNKELIGMIRRLHRDNERDTVAGLREDCAEFIILHKIHERNKIIHMLIQKVKL